MERDMEVKLGVRPGHGSFLLCILSLLGSDSCELPCTPGFELGHSEVLRHSSDLLCPEKGLQVALRLCLHVAPWLPTAQQVPAELWLWCQVLSKYLGPVRHPGGLGVLSCAGALVAMANKPAGAMIHLHGKERVLWRRQHQQESPDAGIRPKRKFRAKE